MPHLPIGLKWYICWVSTMYILGCSQYPKSDRAAFNRIQDLQLLMFADLLWEMDLWAIDTQMAYLQEYLLTPAHSPELQWQVSKPLHPSSTSHRIILAKESSGLWLPQWTYFATSKVAIWWWGTFWFALALGSGTFWSPPGLHSGSAWVNASRSDL